MNLRAEQSWVFVAMILGAALSGCGGDDGEGLPRKAVSGTVNLNGEPLATGSIQFHPTSTGGPGATPVSAGGAIEAGRYSVARKQGLVPGDYKVLILSHIPQGGANDEPPGPRPRTGKPPELIPAEYNTKTKLTAKITADGDNTFNFELEKK